MLVFAILQVSSNLKKKILAATDEVGLDLQIVSLHVIYNTGDKIVKAFGLLGNFICDSGQRHFSVGERRIFRIYGHFSKRWN